MTKMPSPAIVRPYDRKCPVNIPGELFMGAERMSDKAVRRQLPEDGEHEREKAYLGDTGDWMRRGDRSSP